MKTRSDSLLRSPGPMTPQLSEQALEREAVPTQVGAPGERSAILVMAPELSNQIAAGEVVERPRSIVKELCENALDAGATRVDCSLEGGGVALCRIVDDGFGIEPSELETALLRHATSKLRSIDDLGSLDSFGFRGEALPSIASVSRLTLSSRPRGAERGAQVTVAGGHTVAVGPCGMREGTIVEVRDLFYNVPARRKFLRSLSTEAAHAVEAVLGLSLSRPDVSFTVLRDGRTVRLLGAREKTIDRVRDVVGELSLRTFSGARGPLSVEAYLGDIDTARTGTSGLWILVNGRVVHDRALARAAAQAMGPELTLGRYPVGVIYVTLPAALVDVNVHPQKTEVRFVDPRAVFEAVFSVIQGGGATPAPASPVRPRLAFLERREPRADVEFRGSGAMPPPERPSPSVGAAAALRFRPDRLDETDASSRSLTEDRVGPPPLRVREPNLEYRPVSAEGESARFVGQLTSGLLIAETSTLLLVLDVHALSEQTRLHVLREAFRTRRLAPTPLQSAIPIELPASERACVEALGDELLELGFDLRVASSTCVLLAGASPIWSAPEEGLARRVTRALGRLVRDRNRDMEAQVAGLLAELACDGALPPDHRLDPGAIDELLGGFRTEPERVAVHSKVVIESLPLSELTRRLPWLPSSR